MNDTIRVLIIDDNRDIADEIREYLAKSGKRSPRYSRTQSSWTS